MNLGLDYDNTYTRDPDLWDNFITLLKQRGHKVYVVTMRYEHHSQSDEVKEKLASKVDGIYFTGWKAKQPFMFKQGISIDIWIDDNPLFITTDAAT